MAYNESTAEKIREILFKKGVDFTEKKMFMGICFMVDDKMLCGTHIDKKTGEDLLLCRLSDKDYRESLERDDAGPMKMGERTMKSYIFVQEEGHRTYQQMDHWLQLCLDFNPLAKSSKKK